MTAKATGHGPENDRISEKDQMDRASTGVPGLDHILRGGVPRGRSTLICGGAGSGKTILALSTLVNGARESGEPGIFVTFEESTDQLRQSAAAFGWNLSQLEDNQLFFLEARLSPDTVRAGDFDFQAMLAGLESRAENMGARRIVFDGLDVLLELLPDPVAERREAFRLRQWLERMKMTGLITFKGSLTEEDTLLPYGFMAYLVDTIITLQQRLVDRVSVRTVQVLKYRGSGFLEGEFPMVIGDDGMEVSAFELKLRHPRSTERVSSGVKRLDHMLEGGYFRGSTVLMSGASGTAKTSLSGAFAHAACERGEKVLYLSFDESAEQIILNLQSIGLDLEPHLNEFVRIEAIRSEARSAEAHLIDLRHALDEFEPEHLVIDPISAFGKSGGMVAAVHAALRAIDYAKSKGITSVLTSLVPGGELAVERTPVQISTIADTWIHLEYLVRDGERNRTITVVKSRGTSHSDQVRELILNSDGITLADVFIDGGEVLVGTSRWVREQEIKQERKLITAQVDRERRNLDLSKKDAENEIERLELKLQEVEEQIERLEALEKARMDRLHQTRTGIHERRRGDGPAPEPFTISE